MPILGVVPARGGSRRVPGKNLAVLEGRTLVRRALETALASEVLDHVALTSDDRAILEEASGLDVTAIERPAALASAEARSFDVILHAIDEMEKQHGCRYETVVVLQCTSPFTAPDDVRATVDLLRAHPDSASAVSVVEVDMVHHPMKLKRIEAGRLVPFLAPDRMTPSHELPRLYVRNGSVYASRRELIDSGTFVAEDALAHVMPPERSLDIDTPLDLAFAKFLVAQRSSSRPRA